VEERGGRVAELLGTHSYQLDPKGRLSLSARFREAQGRLTLPGRLREAVGINKDVIVLGVRDRMEIWDRASYERYEAAFAGAYQAGTLETH
jgi:DNA-binding transcriptional regulator/RsmH inhibitor MraZ